MFCSNCGSSVGSTQIFCSSCGIRLGDQTLPKQRSANYQPGLKVDFDSENAPMTMNFVETIKFSYKNYARFSGRASRSEYWYWVLFIWLGIFSSAILTGESPVFSLLYLVFIFTAIIPGIARGVRRLHDLNKSGAHLLLGLIPIVGPILLLVWFCKKGDADANMFGPAYLGGFSPMKEVEYKTEKQAIETNSLDKDSFATKSKTFISKYKLLIISTTSLVLLFGVLQAHIQYGKVISAIEVSEAQMTEFNRSEQDIYNKTTSGTPLVFNSSESQTIFENEIKSLAGLYGSRISNAGKTVDGVSLMPWNFKIDDIKSKYMEHNFSWQSQMAAKSIDPYSTQYSVAISSTWSGFCKTLKSGSPWYAFGRFDSRIAEICISDSDPSSSN